MFAFIVAMRCGHLYQGRFKPHVVEEDTYAGELIKYIHLNPIRPENKRKAVPSERKRDLDCYRWSAEYRWKFSRLFGQKVCSS